jgi:hypothetical protein
MSRPTLEGIEMKKLIMIALALVAAPAIAKDGNNGGGNGGCGVGQTTNGCGDSGAGGSGGAGGSSSSGAIGVGIASAQSSANAGAIAAGGSATASTGAIRNDNLNAIRNDIDNRNTISTLVGNTVGDTSASTANANNSTVTVEGDNYRRNPVNTAYSAPLVAGSDTCMGSTTMGAQGSVFGISIGSTWTDKNCVRLKNSRELVEMGYPSAAVQLLCTDKEVKAAMRAAGTPCK